MLSSKKAPTKARAIDALLPSRSFREIVASYARASQRRAVAQLCNTGLPFLLLMVALLCGARSHPGLTLPLAVPAALLLVRLFAIQHDCGHGSFFASRRANGLLGRVLGVLTLTPYACWRKSHAIHHANSGNLDRRGTGDVRTLTVREYQSLSLPGRLRYRLYRHPMVLLGLGPIFLFAIHHRIPTVSPLRHRKIWGSILGTDAALAAIVVLMLLTVGGRAVMLGYLPVILLAAATGIWLFYIQHQFEHTYWAPGSDWNFHAAALNGSSFYDLPALLHWLTGYIGFHHIHHVCSKIPNYRLRECFDENPEFRDARRLTLLDSLKCLQTLLVGRGAAAFGAVPPCLPSAVLPRARGRSRTVSTGFAGVERGDHRGQLHANRIA